MSQADAPVAQAKGLLQNRPVPKATVILSRVFQNIITNFEY